MSQLIILFRYERSISVRDECTEIFHWLYLVAHSCSVQWNRKGYNISSADWIFMFNDQFDWSWQVRKIALFILQSLLRANWSWTGTLNRQEGEHQTAGIHFHRRCKWPSRVFRRHRSTSSCRASHCQKQVELSAAAGRFRRVGSRQNSQTWIQWKAESFYSYWINPFGDFQKMTSHGKRTKS